MRVILLGLSLFAVFNLLACHQNIDEEIIVAEQHTASVPNLIEVESSRILSKSKVYVNQLPRTVTSDIAERSAGGKHDFYSEGDYWWPDPSNPSAPYVRRDGLSNPSNFIAHRRSLMQFSEITATLTSAYIITNDLQYFEKVRLHLLAWFVNADTRMNPNLLYGQAIKGRHTGRSIGIIDTIHLVEVAQSILYFAERGLLPSKELKIIKAWFSEYLEWLNTHEYGIKEKHHPNNHGITWSMQASVFARLVGDMQTLKWVREQFKKVYIAQMMNAEGGFDAELARTKPYGYSLFVIDALAAVAEIASSDQDNLWDYVSENGRSMRLAMNFIVPYIQRKENWPYAKDLEYWDNWPARHISLFFASYRLKNTELISLYNTLDGDPSVYEVLRNMPIRHPLIWQ